MSKTCNTCCRDYHLPYRVYNENGAVVQGCVDDCHTGHLVDFSESAFWHNRPEAKTIRKAMLDRINKVK